jgi:hypothetical protein
MLPTASAHLQAFRDWRRGVHKASSVFALDCLQTIRYSHSPSCNGASVGALSAAVSDAVQTVKKKPLLLGAVGQLTSRGLNK